MAAFVVPRTGKKVHTAEILAHCVDRARREYALEAQAIRDGQDDRIEFAEDRNYAVAALPWKGPEINGRRAIECIAIVRRYDGRRWIFTKQDGARKRWEDTERYALERLFYGSGLLEGEDLTDDEWVDVEAALTVMCPNQYGHSEDFLNRHGLTRVGGTLFEFPAKKPTPAPESAQAKPATPPKAESLEALTYCPGLLGSASTEDQCLVTASETFGMVDQLDGANSTMR